MAIAGLLGAGMRSAGGAMAKSGAKAMTKGMIGRRNKPNQQKSQPEVQKVEVKVASDAPQTGKQISNLSSFLSLPEAITAKSGKSEGVKGVEEKLRAIRDFFAQRFAYSKSNSREKTVKDDRKKKNKREEELEKEVNRLKKKVKVKSALPNVGIFDSIKNFFLYTFLAFLEKKFNFTAQLVKLLPLINGVMDFVIDIGGKILNGLATFIDLGYGLVDTTRKFIENIGGAGFLNAFDKVLGVVNTILNALFIYAMAQSVMPGGGDRRGRGKPGRSGPGGVSSGSRPGQGFRPKVTTTGGGGLNRPDIRNPLRDRPKVTTTGGGTPGRPDIRNPLRSRPTITTGLGKAAAGEAVEKVTKKTAMLAVGKFISPFVKRIPIFGALIDFAINIALGESVGRSIAKAAGAGIGAWAGGALGGMLAAAVGSVVPIAGTALGGAIGFSAGSVLGGLFGDFLGGWLYDRITGVDPVQAKSKGGVVTYKNGINPVQAKSGGGVVTYNNGGEVSDNKEKKLELLPKEKLSTSFNKNDEDTDFNKYLKDSGERLKDIPIVGPIMATAIKALLGHDVKLKDFETIAKGITNVSSLISSGSVETSSDYSRFRSYALGGSVVDDEVKGVQESKVNADNLARFLDTKFNAAGGVGDVLKSGEGKPGSTDGPGSKAGSRDSATGESTSGSDGAMTMGSDFESTLAKLLKNYEGLRTEAYLDSKGIPTIGMGATYYPKGFRLSGSVQMGQSITEEEALSIKQAHIKEHRDRLLSELPSSTYTKVPDNVKAALESKVFNYGSLGGTLTELVTKGTEDGNYKPVSDYFRNSLAGHDGGINSWRRNDEAGIIDTGTSSRAGLSFPKESGSKATEVYEAEVAKASSGSDIPGSDMSTADVGSRERGEGSKLAGELGRFIDSKGLGSYGSGTHQHPEHPSWPKESGHSANSLHYESQGARALDIGGFGPNAYRNGGYTGTDDQTKILSAINEFNSSKGVKPVELFGEYNEPSGHYNHVHVAYQGGGLIGKSPKKYGDMTSKASYEKSGSQVMIQPIIIEKVNQSPMMTPPISALTFSTNGVVNTNNNPVLSRG